MSDINTRPLFTVEFQTKAQPIGPVPHGYQRVVRIIEGGRFEGERLSGRALPGGGDWSFRRQDGVIHLDVRATLETTKGETILMTYGGRLIMSPEAEARLAKGETLGVDDIYSRMLVQFETAVPDLLWLNDIVAIGIGERRPAGPVYHMHEVL